jgi:FKBP-type peptidyl-prolyl cis-trans isomerase
MKTCLVLVALAASWYPVDGLSHPQPLSRRACMTQQIPALVMTAVVVAVPGWAQAASTGAIPPDLKFVETLSGLSYADAKVGTGQPITEKGSSITMDYVMSTTGARYGAKIYSTVERNVPYRFRLGDGTTIQGIELAIAGNGKDVEPMRPGGIRRVIIPASLGYQSLAQPLSGLQYQDCQEGKGVGPIPPTDEGTTAEYYQRFKNIYCNANRPYQPDLVMDIKLYGKR